MTLRQIAAAGALLAACAWGAAAEAVLQQDGSLAEDDATLEDDRYVDWYKVPLTAGARYLVSVRSADFDAAVLLRFADGARLENDDFEGTDGGLVYTAVRSETVAVGVTSSLDPATGSYSVSVEKLGAARSMQAGQKVSRALGADGASAGGFKSDSLMLIGARGDRVAVKVKSGDFAPVLRIQNRSGFAEESSGDSAGDEAALSYLFTQQGQLEIVVRAAGPAEGGKYDLQVDRLPQARSLQAGASLEAQMGRGKELYLLEGKRGRAVVVRVESEEFEPVVQVVDRFGRRASAGDYADGAGPGLHHVFTDDEPVSVAVIRSDDGDTSAYRISVDKSDFDAAEYPVIDLAGLADGDVVEGYLSALDLRRQNRYVHRYTFEGAKDQVVRLELASDSFDAFLEVVGPGGFQMGDDDSLGGYASLVQAICREPGTYTVRVTTAADWETGFYELSFKDLGQADPLLDERGRLDRRDKRDIGGRYFDEYVVELGEGVSLSVEMSSEEVDSYLIVWAPDGEEIYSDDDGGGGNNARVSVTGAAPGKWTIYATSNEKAELGAYSVRAVAY